MFKNLRFCYFPSMAMSISPHEQPFHTLVIPFLSPLEILEGTIESNSIRQPMVLLLFHTSCNLRTSLRAYPRTPKTAA
jgi:hypothetical protein